MMVRVRTFAGLAVRRMSRNAVSSLSCVGTIAVVFLVLSVFAWFSHNLAELGLRMQDSLRLTVFLADETTEPQREAVRSRLEASSAVARIDYVDPGQALERFRRQLGPQAAVLEDLDEKPLPASYEVTFQSTQALEPVFSALAAQVGPMAGVEEVRWGRSWLATMSRIMGAVRTLGLFLGGLLLLAALVIVANTIRLSVLARRNEIEILKLVGASDRFVRLPFYLEGFLLGGAGALLGVGLALVLHALVGPRVDLSPGLAGLSIPLPFLPLIQQGLLVAVGCGLGLVGASSALWRHLRI